MTGRVPLADAVEIHWIDDGDGPAGVVRVESSPPGPTALLVALVGIGDEPVVLLDHDLPPPGRTLELRSSGVWVEIATLQRGSCWQVGLEAFALRVDADQLVTPATHGERVPIGLDLTVTASGHDAVNVEGEALVGAARFEVDGRGFRPVNGPPPHRGEPIRGGLAVSWRSTGEVGPGRLERWLVDGGNGPAWVRGPRQSMSASV